MNDSDASRRVPFDFWSDSEERVRRGRPFWSDFIPYCLFCNWDDDREGSASTLVATTVQSGRRKAVAFLCVECFGEPEIRAWFEQTVRERFPTADIEDRSGKEEPWDPESL